jgi:hypothetical protein
VAWLLPATVVPAGISSPLSDTSRYGYLGGQIVISAFACAVRINWFADAAATVQVGQRNWVIDSAGPTLQQLRVPNLGPYCQMSLTPLTGAGCTVAATILPTNRVHPLEFIPVDAQLITAQVVAVTTGVDVGVFPVDFYAGPVRVWVDTPLTSWRAYLEGIAGGGAYLVTDEWTGGAGQVSVTTVAPPGSWRLGLGNLAGGTGNITVAVSGSTTGSI